MKPKRTKLSGKKLSREDLDKLIAAADRARERVSKRNAISRSDPVSGYAPGFSRTITMQAIKDMADGLSDEELSGLFHHLEAIYKTRRQKRSFYGVH